MVWNILLERYRLPEKTSGSTKLEVFGIYSAPRPSSPQRPSRAVDHNVSIILNGQVRSRMPLGGRGPNRSRGPVKHKIPICLHDRLRDCAAVSACCPPGCAT